jgi:hypothetical protein
MKVKNKVARFHALRMTPSHMHVRVVIAARLLNISRRTKTRLNYTISGRQIIYLCTKFFMYPGNDAAPSIPKKCKVHFNSLRKKALTRKLLSRYVVYMTQN